MNKRKIAISISIVILLIIGVFALFKYLGGFPIGFKNGKLIIYQYYCSDVCPQYGGWHAEYFRVNNKEDCEKIGGYPLIDYMFGGFVGCTPK